MTLRLDEQTSSQLRWLSEATGTSQQQLVSQAVKDYVTRTQEARRQRREKWRQLMKLGRVAGPDGPEIELPWAAHSDALQAEARARHPQIDPKYVRLARGRLRPPDVLMPSPPGGILSYLDREDRV